MSKFKQRFLVEGRIIVDTKFHFLTYSKIESLANIRCLVFMATLLDSERFSPKDNYTEKICISCFLSSLSWKYVINEGMGLSFNPSGRSREGQESGVGNNTYHCFRGFFPPPTNFNDDPPRFFWRRSFLVQQALYPNHIFILGILFGKFLYC